MSTRSCIARVQADGFQGRYIHSDGYVEGVGAQLCHLYHEVFDRDLEKMLKVLIDDHPAGWSTIHGDWTQEPGFIEYGSPYDNSHRRFITTNDGIEFLDTPCRPQCYCHGDRHEEEQTITHEDASECGCEYVYAFARDGFGNPIMNILVNYNEDSSKAIGMFGMGNPNATWKIVEQIYLDDLEPDWKAIETKIFPEEE